MYYLRLKRLRRMAEQAEMAAKMDPRMALADAKAQGAVHREIDRMKWALAEYERWHHERTLDAPWVVRPYREM